MLYAVLIELIFFIDSLLVFHTKLSKNIVRRAASWLQQTLAELVIVLVNGLFLLDILPSSVNNLFLAIMSPFKSVTFESLNKGIS